MAVDKLVDSALLDADLTSVANAIRTKGGTSASLAFPSGFVTAIGNISGGGGGSKTNIDIGVETTSIPNILNMFYALEQGTAVTNEFTLAQAIPNTEVEVLDTGLSTVHGLFIADKSQGSLVSGNTPENVLFTIVFNPTSEGTGSYAVTRQNNYLGYATNTNGVTRKFLARCTWRVSGGKLYCTGDFNRNDSYTPFCSGHTYRWVAW